VASAFISYAHEDQELVLDLVEYLRAQGLDIRYDQVVLQIGDSLIQKISREIANGDFLIAIVSPDSVESGWCQRELSLAATQGINENRIKVLPVRFRNAEMPELLGDTYWADADSDTVETVARRLAAAIRANLEGREAEAGRAAEEVEEAEGAPAHGEMAGNVEVEEIDEVAQRAWDVFQAWTGVWDGGNVRDLDDPQRRLRWALDGLPDRLRAALPLVEQLANADWDGFFAGADSDGTERDIRAELRSLRTRVAQGLPVVGRWSVVNDLGEVSAGRRDATAFLWGIQRGQEQRQIAVYISGTAMMADWGLPEEVVAAKNTHGRSVLATVVGLDDPPHEVSVTTAGVRFGLPD
jgi:TIR domain-containing protein